MSRSFWAGLVGRRLCPWQEIHIQGIPMSWSTEKGEFIMQAKKHAEEQAQQKGRPKGEHKVSLWRALWTGFGWPYISLGLLKLFSDALNFAGLISAHLFFHC